MFQGIKKYYLAVSELATSNGINRFGLLFDCAYSYLRYGCVLNQYIDGAFYAKRSFQRKRILTYRKWCHIVNTYNNKGYIHFLQNKVEFNTLFKDLIGRDWLYSKEMTLSQFETFANRHDIVIVKPVDDWEGNGIRKIDLPKDDVELEYLFHSLKNEQLLLEEVVEQHPSMVFGNKSVNTIRVYTVYDDATQEAYVFKTTLRAGVGESIVDNSHSGGQAYEVDIETGAVDSRSWSHATLGLLVHPGTDIVMLGVKIPFWAEVLNLCKSAAEKLHQVRYIGWDVAVKEDGPILIEGNHDPDLDLVEFVGGSGYLPMIMKHLRNSKL